MKEKNILKIKEVESLIEKSKAADRFNLVLLISKDDNLLDIGERFPVQIYIGTEEDFVEINNYLLKEQANSDKEKHERIETLRSVIWHFRQLQEKQNAEAVESRNMSKYGMYKVPMPQTAKNSKGELCDYESRTVMKEFFNSIEELIDDKDSLRKIINKYIGCLPSKQQFIVNEILNNNTQADICKKHNMNRKTVSGLYNRAVKNLRELTSSNKE